MRMRANLVVAAVAVLAAPPVGGQSALERAPNLSGGWVGEPGRLYFHFLHRFEAGDAPARKVTNTPTFLMGVGLPGNVLLAANYATNSNVAAGRPNEWELLGRWSALHGGPLSVAVQAGYNQGAKSADGELSAGYRAGPVRLFAVGRSFTGWRDTDDLRWAVGGGAALSVRDGIALAADVVTPLDPADGEDVAWSAGVQLRLPYTPHTVSLHASNAVTTTLQGSTVGSGRVRYGFEFTIPVTLRRYLPASEPSSDSDMPMTDMPMMADTVEIHMENLKYGMERVMVTPGTTVVWVNDDPVAHTSTSDEALWDSDLIAPGERWARTFTEPGSYPYHCTPHPFMRAVVVVRDMGRT